MSKDEIAIKVDGVTKHFLLPHQRAGTIKSMFVNPFSRTQNERQKALDDVSFEVKKGEFFGIVGRNGSGKSTLLKCMAGVYTPEHGRIITKGTLVPFIELGVGFNPELSGRDNVFLNGALLGFNRSQMEVMYQEIVEFAELDNFMDQKLKNYSSGMQVRLAFSIAIRAKGDILLLDEVLAVGDTAFQKKCNDYFYNLKDQKQTVILVTHSMGAVEEYCDRALLLESGKIIEVGSPTRIADKYNEINLRTSQAGLAAKNSTTERSEDNSNKNKIAEITKVETYNTKTREPQDTFTFSEKIGVRYHIVANKVLDHPAIGLVFKDIKKNTVFATNTPSIKFSTGNINAGQKFIVEFDIDNTFTNDDYQISGAVASKDRTEVYHRVVDCHKFEIGGWKLPQSIAHPPHTVKISKSK